MKSRVNRIARDLAVEQSLDAAIEIEDVIRGARSDAPAFEKLIVNLIGSPAGDFGTLKRELLSDSRLASLYYRAASASRDLAANTDRVLGLLLSAGSVNLSQMSKNDLAMVRDFCVGLNQELVSEAFNRTPEPPLARARQRIFTIDACRV